MTLLLARLPIQRVLRTRRGSLLILGWTAVAAIAAIAARASSDPNGADHAIRRTFGFVVLPLVTYGIVAAALGGDGLRRSLRGVVAIGAAPEKAALATVGAAIALSACVAGAIATLVCAVAHGPLDPPLAKDLPASFGVAFAGGAAYAAYFCAGSAIGRGAMRGLFLALDFVLGAPGGLGALFVPRGHVKPLLGGAPTFEMQRSTSSVALVLLLLFYAWLALRLTRRAARS